VPDGMTRLRHALARGIYRWTEKYELEKTSSKIETRPVTRKRPTQDPAKQRTSGKNKWFGLASAWCWTDKWRPVNIDKLVMARPRKASSENEIIERQWDLRQLISQQRNEAFPWKKIQPNQKKSSDIAHH
jgi:hypothetical protein